MKSMRNITTIEGKFLRAAGLEKCRKCGGVFVCNSHNFPRIVDRWPRLNYWVKRKEKRAAKILICGGCLRNESVKNLQVQRVRPSTKIQGPTARKRVQVAMS
jgi:hypothetical protein